MREPAARDETRHALSAVPAQRIPLALSAAGCGGGGGPVDTAVVSINLPNGNVAATTFPCHVVNPPT